MSAPIFFFSNLVCHNFCKTKCKVDHISKASQKFIGISFGLAIADALISLTALVVGILGVLSVIGMPPAAAYTLIGVSGLITLPWLATAIFIIGAKIKECCDERAKAAEKAKFTKKYS